MHKKVYLFKRVLHFYEVFFLKKWDLFLLCVVEIDKKNRFTFNRKNYDDQREFFTFFKF